jgi:uncharacterized protein YggU (UPF0235/DUF167 family)
MKPTGEEPVLRVTVRLTPRASSNAVLPYGDGVLFLRLTAPPVEGAANASCRAYVADLLGLRPSQVSVCHGHKSRDKAVTITGLSEEIVRERLIHCSRG